MVAADANDPTALVPCDSPQGLNTNNQMVFKINEDEISFPDPRLGEEDGLLAVGGDLSVDRLLLAYSHGIFPWYSFEDEPEILWWCPMKRFVIFPKEIHISHSMKQLLRKGEYTVTFNQAFEAVIDHCGKAQQRNEMKGAWLGDDMKAAYTALHEMGFAVSVEVWHGEELVGGLYGVNIGCNFFGESMFSLAPSASKVALITLAQYMEKEGGDGIIDCQLETDHLRSMGGRFISYDEYMEILNSEYDDIE